MATAAPTGDPALSQDQGPAQLQWQNRTARMPQYVGLSDADASAGALANPTSPAAAPTTPSFGTPTPAATPAPTPAPFGATTAPNGEPPIGSPERAAWEAARRTQAQSALTPAATTPAPQQSTTQLGSIEPGNAARAVDSNQASLQRGFGQPNGYGATGGYAGQRPEQAGFAGQRSSQAPYGGNGGYGGQRQRFQHFIQPQGDQQRPATATSTNPNADAGGGASNDFAAGGEAKPNTYY